MEGTKAGVFSVVALIMCMGFALACGGGGSSGSDGISDTDTAAADTTGVTGEITVPESLKDLNLVDFHASYAATDANNDLCISCHGEMTHAETLSSTVREFHVEKASVMASYDCVDCHKAVDLLQGSGGNLRKQIDVEDACYSCHGPGAISTQLYQ